MSLEEDNDGHFYHAAGNEVGTGQVQRGVVLPASLLDPRKRFMDRPDADAAPESFARGVNLDG